MATGQVLLQRYYFSKSMVKHDIEVIKIYLFSLKFSTFIIIIVDLFSNY